MNDQPADSTVLLQAEDLGGAQAGMVVFQHLSFAIRPGLSLVRGGDGRGKTTLLRLMAGTQSPASGQLRRWAETVFHEDMADSRHDAVVARAWLAAQRLRLPEWDADLASNLIDAFGLSEHIDKPLYMLSTGSRRKVGLVAAASGHARLTLLDMPYAALDAASRGLLSELLADAALNARNAWVIADFERHPSLAGVPLSSLVDLGD